MVSAPRRIPPARLPRAASKTRPSQDGAIIIPLDAPPLVKLAEHVRQSGLIAVAFPTHVLVLIERQDGCCGRFAVVRITTFSEALGIVRPAGGPGGDRRRSA